MRNVRNILFPTDFSTHSKAAIPTLRDVVSADDNVTIHLVHVVDSGLYVTDFTWGGFSAEEFHQRRLEQARESLRMFTHKVDLEHADFEVSVIQGVPARELVEYAEEHDIDLIVMATHGRTGLDHLFMGSTAERVVRTAPCPVLTVRPAETKTEVPLEEATASG